MMKKVYFLLMVTLLSINGYCFAQCINVALGKPTTASETWNGNVSGILLMEIV